MRSLGLLSVAHAINHAQAVVLPLLREPLRDAPTMRRHLAQELAGARIGALGQGGAACCKRVEARQLELG